LRFIAVILSTCFLTIPAGAQTDSASTVSPVKFAIVTGITGGILVAVHLYQQNAWWKDHRTKFHVREDLTYACNVDKLGHLYAASALTFGFGKSFQWAGFDESSSLFWGAIGSMVFQTVIEVEDGFSTYWGFDRVDYASDIIGAWYPYLQNRVPVLKNFQFRFSYLPKDAGQPSAIPGQTKAIFDDYEGQTIWLTVTPHELLPETWKSWWPKWIAVALGVSVRNNVSPDRHLVWYLAPDLDMREIVPQSSGFLRALGEALNFFHFPMPAVRIAPGVIWYGLYF
jgi:hypothetical protein